MADMMKKTCTQCGKDSYSATDRGSWYCPYCNHDLSKVEAQPVSPRKEKNKQVKNHHSSGKVNEGKVNEKDAL